MGGYSSAYEGELAGLKTGLTSDLPLYEHTRELDCRTLTVQYLVNFGVGFVKGQQYRSRLSEVLPQVGLNKKAEALVWLRDNTFERFHFTKFEKAVEAHLQRPGVWDNKEIPVDVYNESIRLLNTRRFQPAFGCIEEYYEKNLNLLARIDFESISSELKKIRFAKRASKLFNSKAALLELEAKLYSWLEEYKKED